jgi:hypothetical protein
MESKFIERPGVLSEDQAKPYLEPYTAGLVEDFHEGWDWVQAILEQDTERRVTFDTSTVAAMVFNRFVVLTGRRLDGDDGVLLRKHGRMMRALIGNGRIALRFKKLTKKMNGALCAGQIQTNAQVRIFYQLGFDGMEDAKPTEITFGYTTDEANTIVTGLYFTCPISFYNNKWAMVLEGGENEDRLPFAVPSDPNQPVPDQATVLITPKVKKPKKDQG